MRKFARVLIALAVSSAALAAAGTAQAGPFSCGTTVTADITLTFDLACPGSSGIVIGAPRITIDLGGHTLSGDRTPHTYGIGDTAGYSNVTVRNGTIARFDEGVRVDGTDVNDIVVTHLVISGNTGAGTDITASFSLISHVRARHNGASGIAITGDSNRVVAVKANHNTYGIYVMGGTTGGGPTTVRASVASYNGRNGILVAYIDGALIGQQPGGPSSDKNRADTNGTDAVTRADGYGIRVTQYTTPPTGQNEAGHNGEPAQCDPSSLCS